jgi:CheY-like chemotaxis protein
MTRVLIVEDEDVFASVVREILTDAGHETLIATNGLDALRLAREHRPEVVLLDIMLPILGGHEVRAKLAEDEALSRCRVVAMTSANLRGPQRDAYDAVLEKPFSLDALLAVIDALAEGGRTEVHAR